ncbi:kinesin-like protein kif15 [Stylonychia lemnae]|uniref:Kinesin-like protein kif15 n=1 Tax=Stylonychia lemnae TaxID=5949 RepID=A0A078A0G3_STYLE|nr:kinesin-like protein kif15 [Stylonychia lemnae]|eukprot:CDW75640.1 kinesin-like protein kif15 [Stylonychia lemnae]
MFVNNHRQYLQNTQHKLSTGQNTYRDLSQDKQPEQINPFAVEPSRENFENEFAEGVEQANPSSKEEVYIKVSARVRPLLNAEQDHDSVINVIKDKKCLKVFTNHYFNNGERNFYFENVIDSDSNQGEVFDDMEIKDMCEAFIKQGKNCNILVYGPTSTGKTFTMQGDLQNHIKSSIIKSMFDTVTNNICQNEDLIGKDQSGVSTSKHKKTLSNINGYINKNPNLKKSFILDESNLQQKILQNQIPPGRNRHRQSPLLQKTVSYQFTSKESQQLNTVLSHVNRGLIPRTLDCIYSIPIQKDKFEFKVSFMEIYNDIVTDLLDSDSSQLGQAQDFNYKGGKMTSRQQSTQQQRPNKQYQIKENIYKGVYVENLTEHRANTLEEAYIFLLYGLQRKKIFATVKNQESSRSHTIFQIKLSTKPQPQNFKQTNRSMTQQNQPQSTIVSKFTLIDLAGSERLNEGEKTMERVEEAKFINKSLSALGNVIYALKNQQNVYDKHQHKRASTIAAQSSNIKNKFSQTAPQNLGHIPYRDSKLTHILKDSLGGNSHTHIIITLSPSAMSLNETLSSMKFAHNAKSIKQHVKENIFFREIDEKQVNSFECQCQKDHQCKELNDSFDSEELIELSRYYENQENQNFIKNELENQRKKVSKLPKSSKMLRQLFRKTLDKLKKYKNDQQTMQVKIMDLQHALELKEILAMKSYEELISKYQDQIVDGNSSPVAGSKEKSERLSMNLVKSGWGMKNEFARYNSRSLKSLMQQDQSRPTIQETTELLSLSQNNGAGGSSVAIDDISRFTSSMKDETQNFIQQNQLNMMQILKKREEFLHSESHLNSNSVGIKYQIEFNKFNLDQDCLNNIQGRTRKNELDSVKASIDHTDLQKQCNEELATISQNNKSKIEEPLIYKTMHHCIESSSQYYCNVYSQHSGYFTPKQQSFIINPQVKNTNQFELILGSGGRHFKQQQQPYQFLGESSKKQIQSARASQNYSKRIAVTQHQQNNTLINSPFSNQRLSNCFDNHNCDEFTYNDCSHQRQFTESNAQQISFKQFWRNLNKLNKEDKLFADRTNKNNIILTPSVIQSERSSQNKHFNFLDSASNLLSAREKKQQIDKCYSSNQSIKRGDEEKARKMFYPVLTKNGNLGYVSNTDSAAIYDMIDEVSFETNHDGSGSALGPHMIQDSGQNSMQYSLGAISFGVRPQKKDKRLDKSKENNSHFSKTYDAQPNTTRAIVKRMTSKVGQDSTIDRTSKTRSSIPFEKSSEYNHVASTKASFNSKVGTDVRTQILSQALALVQKRNKSQNLNAGSGKIKSKTHNYQGSIIEQPQQPQQTYHQQSVNRQGLTQNSRNISKQTQKVVAGMSNGFGCFFSYKKNNLK